MRTGVAAVELEPTAPPISVGAQPMNAATCAVIQRERPVFGPRRVILGQVLRKPLAARLRL